ncbi:MarR family transcriptional regulator [Dyella sp. LX-66]|uniref:MarR family winged helix-turn-helix transcriptional regulator n=1 Tax=unclassified Dyella TaxID=2634549 RepID=UPI001BE02FF8|nr:MULTISPECIES: MarR family transcriptional regulator [unclassified Dyella]MBT2119633.1 MarR family transcriptional regulator [Dyella sp. LX-1]MBT2141328.1 MarR family transcriptional regulator [Dyella sp. LX-66]MBT2142060.1 MarR family transcriptional regulator [Dyella sp. LX-66]
MGKSTASTPMRPRIGQLINRASRLLLRAGDARLRPLGLAGAQIPVVAMLKHHGPMTQKQLAEMAQIEQPSMAQTLARMERDGMVERRADPADGRSSFVHLTELALGKLPEAQRVLNLGERRMLAGLEEGEVLVLMGLLQRVVGNLEREMGVA